MVTDKVLREYALALRDPNPLWHDKGYAEREGRFARRVAPSAFCLTLNPMERVGLKPASDFWEEIFGEPGDYWGGHAAYNRFELARPIYVGDTITTEVSNRDCYEKEGKRALLVVAESQYRMTNQDGEYVGLGIYGNMVQRPYPDA
jgi:acyl dehydratase